MGGKMYLKFAVIARSEEPTIIMIDPVLLVGARPPTPQVGEVELVGVDLVAPYAAPGRRLFFELGLRTTPREKDEGFRVIAFLASAIVMSFSRKSSSMRHRTSLWMRRRSDCVFMRIQNTTSNRSALSPNDAKKTIGAGCFSMSACSSTACLGSSNWP